uniref:Uncharacterized protein n=1 Tax=Candidatus Berkiella cookevillensis TaxID=437022 RepID=A0A0Q9YCK0_9GAMM
MLNSEMNEEKIFTDEQSESRSHFLKGDTRSVRGIYAEGYKKLNPSARTATLNERLPLSK